MKQLLQEVVDLLDDIKRGGLWLTKAQVGTVDKLRSAIEAPEQEPFGWTESSEIEQSLKYGGSVDVWLKKYDCDVPLYARPQPVAERYPLPGSLYPDSKDWVQGDYAERVEWLHSMYENQKAQTEMYVQMSQPVAELTPEEVKTLIEACADEQWPGVGHVGWTPSDAEFYGRVARAVLAAQRGKA